MANPKELGCDGAGDINGDHCCYIEGNICHFLEQHTLPGRRYACGLLRELGSWDLVYQDPRYIGTVKPYWDKLGIAPCGDWPNRISKYEDKIRCGHSSTCCFGRQRIQRIPKVF